jgi:hypothetical protein
MSFRLFIPVLFYLLMLLGLGILSYEKPDYNWDMLPYTAVMLQYDHPVKDIHQQVYQLAARELPADMYNLLAGNSNPDRKKWREDAGAFRLLLPFYVVKPFYTFIAYAFFKLGMPVFKATVMPSVIAYLMTGMLLLVWLSKYLKIVVAAIICAIIMLLPPIAEAATYSSPDFLAGMLLFYAVYFLIEIESINGFFLLGLLSVLSRIDFILPLLILLISLKVQFKVLTMQKLVFLMSIAVIIYLLISSNAYSYGWNLLFFPSFMGTLHPHANAPSFFKIHDYWEILKSQVMTALYHSNCAWLALISVLTLLQYSFKEMKSSRQVFVLISLLISLMVRFLLQPVVADRFYIGYYLIILCLFIIRLSPYITGSAAKNKATHLMLDH